LVEVKSTVAWYGVSSPDHATSFTAPRSRSGADAVALSMPASA
jgi:hypothetical protein